jgi:hypothetical protein
MTDKSLVYSEVTETFDHEDPHKCFMVGQFTLQGCARCKFIDQQAKVGEPWCTYPGTREYIGDKCQMHREI